MKLDNFMDALGEVEDRYVAEAAEQKPKRRQHPWRAFATVAAAAVLVLAIGIGGFLPNRDTGKNNPPAVNNPGAVYTPSADPQDAPTVLTAAPEPSAAAMEPPGAANGVLQVPENAPGDAVDAAPEWEPAPDNDPANGEDLEEPASPAENTLPAAPTQLLAEPAYPVREQRSEENMSAWHQEQRLLALSESDTAAFRPYLSAVIPTLLAGETGQNTVCSPMSLYFSMAMLAETTGGSSQQQILDLLGPNSLEALRAQVSQTWNALYMEDGSSHLDLADSLWLRSGTAYSPTVLQSLAANYYAAAYSGTPGSPSYDALLQQWLNDHTGGLLQDPVSGLHMDPNAVLALVSAISYQDSWDLDPADTAEGIFHAPGGDVSAMMMHAKFFSTPVWQTDTFTALRLDLANSQMLLVLPNEGIAPEALLEDGTAMQLLSGQVPEDCLSLEAVSLTLPRFDVEASADLIEALQSLSITDIFGADTADFSPLGDSFAEGTPDPVVVSRILQAARVSIDESGCQGAAFTYVEASYTGIPDEQEPIPIFLDRPFLFAVLKENLPVFTGIVNNPN